MHFISFETSNKVFSLAVNRDEKVLRFRNLKSSSVLEDVILPAMDKLLDSAGIKFNQIDGFAIALGPGSFTSLRVGLATVKAFAMSTGKPVVGIPSLDIIAHGVKPAAYDEICVINDARRGNIYAALYAFQHGMLKRKTDYLLTTLDDALDRVHGKTLFVGDALEIYRKDIEAAYKKYAGKSSTCQCSFADNKFWHPQAKVMAALAYERFSHKEYDDPVKLSPLYLYAQDCQVSKK
jgi:tRNA threonylcarbamoyladenosine biosynthesis protein TsaB